MARIYLALEALREESAGELRSRKRKRQQMRHQFNYISIPDAEFTRNYRLNKSLFEEICRDVVPLLPVRKNAKGIDPIIKVLTALSFFATGSYQGVIGNNIDAPMAQQTVSKCIREVATAMNSSRIFAKYIKFPQNRQERTRIQSRFNSQYGFPGVVGCIDCTHVAITRPSANEERFLNRKSFHSINVQMICDADNYILNVDASYGGATHDAFIWNASDIKTHFENIVHQGETAFLLGDSGYPLREYLLTPFGEAAADSPEDRFNRIQKRARSTIERTFGILKGRFRCLLSAREMYHCPDTAGKITIACCVLHNLCIQNGVSFPELTEVEMLNDQNQQPNLLLVPPTTGSVLALRRGQSFRNSIVHQLGLH